MDAGAVVDRLSPSQQRRLAGFEEMRREMWDSRIDTLVSRQIDLAEGFILGALDIELNEAEVRAAMASAYHRTTS